MVGELPYGTIEIEGKEPRAISPALESVVREWHEKSAAYFGAPLPILLAAQSESPFAHDTNPVNTALLHKWGGEDLKLVVILANVANAPEELIAHEILHKTLEIDGFHDLRHTESPNSLLQTIMNSMLAHTPLAIE